MESFNEWLGSLIFLTIRWRMSEKRTPMNKIVKTTFGRLLTIAEGLNQTLDICNLEGAFMLKSIFKIFYTSIQVCVSSITKFYHSAHVV
jgi:hypothetical protein